MSLPHAYYASRHFLINLLKNLVKFGDNFCASSRMLPLKVYKFRGSCSAQPKRFNTTLGFLVVFKLAGKPPLFPAMKDPTRKRILEC